MSYEINELGLLIEWPFMLTFEGARYTEEKMSQKQFVALSINETNPTRVLLVCRPYERYIEHYNVPATLWTPISFMLSTLLTDVDIGKVTLDTVVLGVVYRETFFCFRQPLLEGKPCPKPFLNADYILSSATFDLEEDANVKVLEKFKLNDEYSLHRVKLKNLSLETWCLSKSSNTDPYPKNVQMSHLVKMWTKLFLNVSNHTLEADVTAVRLALMLAKHKVCFQLNQVEKANEIIRVSNNDVNFYMHDKIVQFINDVRMIKMEPSKKEYCILS